MSDYRVKTLKKSRFEYSTPSLTEYSCFNILNKNTQKHLIGVLLSIYI